MRSFILRNVKNVSGEWGTITIKNGIIQKVDWISEGGQHNTSQSDRRDDLSEHLPELDCQGAYVSSGWIDLHVHAFSDFLPYGDDMDEIGVKQGVTTIVDAGSCGADRIADLWQRSSGTATNVLAFLNVSRIGLARTDELSNMEWIDEEKALNAIENYAEMIVGLKARISRSVVRDNGLRPLTAARSMAQAASLPLMVHIGSGPPYASDVLALLERKDIVTHYLNGKPNNLFNPHGTPNESLIRAVQRGVHLDVGHGTASFSFRIAEAAKRQGIPLGTISTDMYRANRLNGPVYSMTNVLSKFLQIGYTLEQVIEAITVRAAHWLGRPELGRIRAGDTANLTLFHVTNEPVAIIDSEGEQRIANTKFNISGVVANGTFLAC